MGREARCRAEVGGWEGEGKLLLETDEVVFRGARRLVVRLSDIASVESRDGWLIVGHPGGEASFELGDAASRWAHAITHPKTLVDKLGVKPDSRVLVLGLADDGAFMADLRARTASVETGGTGGDYDLILVRTDDASDLAELAGLAARIRRTGGVWVVHPKGRPDLSHGVLTGAARAAGLIDNKTARFSATHTALRFVIPRDLR